MAWGLCLCVCVYKLPNRDNTTLLIYQNSSILSSYPHTHTHRERGRERERRTRARARPCTVHRMAEYNSMCVRFIFFIFMECPYIYTANSHDRFCYCIYIHNVCMELYAALVLYIMCMFYWDFELYPGAGAAAVTRHTLKMSVSFSLLRMISCYPDRVLCVLCWYGYISRWCKCANVHLICVCMVCMC